MSQIEDERQLDDEVAPQLDLGDERALSTEEDRAALAPRATGTAGPRDGAPADTRVERERSMLPERRERPPLESAFVRAIATAGVVGIGVALAAILASQNVAGWIVGLVVSLLSVVLSAILWSSRRL